MLESDRTPKNFGIGLAQLEDLVERYRKRKYDEDIQGMEDLGGVAKIAEKLRVSLEQGLTGDENDFKKREDDFGSNFRPPPERTPFCTLFCGALEDFMLRLLLVCAVISIAFDLGFADSDHRKTAWIEGTAIFFAVFIVASVGSWNDYKKEEQFLKLHAISDSKLNVKIKRNGVFTELHQNFIQVGDIIEIHHGMEVPVDGVVIRGTDVLTNESAMTGESDEMKKESLAVCKQKFEEKEAEFSMMKHVEKSNHDLPSPILLSGTSIQTGEGEYMCIVVGDHSCIGKIRSKLESNVETTALQDKLEAIGTDIGKVGMYCALLTVQTLFYRFFIIRFVNRTFDLFGGGEDTGNFYNVNGSIKAYCSEWIRYFILGVTIIVVAVPEGLPLAVMISLAYSVRKMLIDQNFVKRLASCEIMGGANNICSDKTGTLTMNQMTVTNIWAGKNHTVKVNEDKYDFKDYFVNESHIKFFKQALCLNTIGTINESSATEKSMIKMMDKFSVNIEDIRKQYLPENFQRFQFSSKRKRMSTIMQFCDPPAEFGYDKRIHQKGASEIVLESCSHYLNQDGQRIELQDGMKSNLNEVITAYAKQALRTISFAYKDLKRNEGGSDHNEMDEHQIRTVERSGYTLICILGIKDIIRKEVPEAVEKCQKAGIIVRMVTGDNKITATAIARECNIITISQEIQDAEQFVIMEGPDFYRKMGGLKCKTCNQMSPCKCEKKKVVETVVNMDLFKKKVWKNLRVLARSRPEDKYLLVTGLKECGDTVAVTGDGTNDAPALKKADVGFAMGITGTEVAKNAADIILMDDNFASIVRACMWGRNIYDSIRKFLQFQLSVNIVALITAFIGSCILIQSPLQSIQLLWVNMIMDSLGALALATEEPREELLSRPPYKKDEYIVSRKMVKHILGISIYQVIVIYVIVFAGEHFYPEPEVKWRFERATHPYVYPGRLYDWDNTPLYVLKYANYGPSHHMTNIFNIFVILQIFNMINCRKINDELNVFSGIQQSKMFMVIWVLVFGVQAIIVEVTAIVFEVSYGGLPWQHWVIAIVLGLIEWVWSFILRFLPDSVCPQFGKKQKNPFEDEDHSVLSLRKQRTKSISLRQPSGELYKEGSGRAGSGRQSR